MTTKEKLLKTITDGKTLGADFRYRDLSGMNFEYFSLKGIDFRGSNLSNCTFAKCNLSLCLFDGANLKGATFENVRGENVKIREANFAGASFEDTYFCYSELHRSKFLNCYFLRTRIEKSDISGVSFSGEKMGIELQDCNGFATIKTLGKKDHSGTMGTTIL